MKQYQILNVWEDFKYSLKILRFWKPLITVQFIKKGTRFFKKEFSSIKFVQHFIRICKEGHLHIYFHTIFKILISSTSMWQYT